MQDLIDNVNNICRRYKDDILNGIDYIHVNGILHLDISDDNIMLDNDLNCVITDFGLSDIEYKKDNFESNLILGIYYLKSSKFDLSSNYFLKAKKRNIIPSKNLFLPISTKIIKKNICVIYTLYSILIN